MIDEIIAEMGHLFRKGTFDKRTRYTFVLEETSISVTVDAGSFQVERGVYLPDADCICKTSSQMFKKIWYDGYKPGIIEFLTGQIECNDPLLLPRFLQAFGK